MPSTLDRSYIVLTKILCLVVISTAILTGCSSTQTSNETLSPVQTWQSTYEPGELNGESLYDLLVAELAGHQQQYDISLAKYLKQAELTGDPGIIRRAARIAQFQKDTVSLEKIAHIWIKFEPESQEPQTLLVGMLIQQNQYSTALPYLDKALHADSHPILSLLNSHAAKMPLQDAHAYLDKLIKETQLTPKNSELWLSRGVFERHLQDSEQALQSFNKAIRYNPDSEAAIIQKADLLKEEGRYKEALAVISTWLTKDPENKQLNILKVQTLYKANLSAAAVKQSRLLISNFENDKKLHLYLALLALDFNRLTDSKNMLSTILQQSNDHSLNFYLGLIEEQQNNPELAIQLYLQVSEGNNILQAYTRALALLPNAKNEPRVNDIMKQAVIKHADLAPDLINLHADWLRSFDFKDSAISHLDEGVAAYPEHIPLRYSRAMMRPPEEFAQAEKELRVILEKEPDNAMAMNALGYTLSLYTERYDEAYQLLSKAIQIKPQDPAIMDSIGWTLYKLQRFEDALAFLKKAYKLYPDAEVGSHLIAVLVALNKKPEAKLIFTELSNKFPNNLHLQDAHKLLNGSI